MGFENEVLAGNVWRIEVITNKPSTLTAKMEAKIYGLLKADPDIVGVKIRELFENIEYFEKEN